MKKIILIMCIISFVLSSCGPRLEEGPCTDKFEAEYRETFGWFSETNNKYKNDTYDTYEEYLSVYRKPLEKWQSIEPVTTCDAALIDLMTQFLTINPEEEQTSELIQALIYFRFDSPYTGK